VAHPLDVAGWKGTKSGRVAILCGGLSAERQPLERIDCPILGVNHSWNRIAYPRTFAHVLSSWQYADERGRHILASWPDMPLFQKTWGGHAGLIPGTIPLRKSGREKFSFDCSLGVWTHSAPILTLQLVIYLGFTEIVFVGLDLKVPPGNRIHWWDDSVDTSANNSWARQMHALQRKALLEARGAIQATRPDVRVFNVSDDTACEAYPSTPFDVLFP
jgi:hypothetical protein